MHFYWNLTSHLSGLGREDKSDIKQLLTSQFCGCGRECLWYSRGKGKSASLWNLDKTDIKQLRKKTSRTLEATESKILNELHLFS